MPVNPSDSIEVTSQGGALALRNDRSPQDEREIVALITGSLSAISIYSHDPKACLLATLGVCLLGLWAATLASFRH